jgi:hypothetical protein
MGFDTYWFENKPPDNDFDFSNCIFWAEGYDDSFIPLNKSSIYYVHCAYDPQKYVGNVGRFVDVRYNAISVNHPNYIYKLDKKNTPQINRGCYYQQSTNRVVDFENGKCKYRIDDFDKLYMGWATNLLPHEFKEEDVYFPRENIVYFLGTLSSDGAHSNVEEINQFALECEKNGVLFKFNDFYSNPLNEESYIEYSKRSLMGFDVRSKNMIEWGHVPCRVYKNMSYGHLGMTNSHEVYNELEGNLVYNSNITQLYYDVENKLHDYGFIINAQNYIKDYHTYVNRARAMLEIL